MAILRYAFQYCTMFGYLIPSDHQLYRVTPLKTPFGLLIPLLQSQSHVTTITIISYAVTRLHSYNPYTPIFHPLIVSITHIRTSNKHSVHTLRSCFLPKTYCLALTLKIDFVSPMAFRITPLNGNPENGQYIVELC
jgi:hypothetical protein